MSKTAGVIAPPPLIYLAGAGLGLIADWLLQFDALKLSPFVRWVLCGLLAIAGGAIIAAALGQFGQARTPPEPWKPTTALATDGIYAYTRNPMYLGMALLLLAWATFLGSPLAGLSVFLFIGYISRFQIIPEERILRAKFGAPYTAYLSDVRRWF